MKNYLDLYIYGLQNYKNFSGRACRREMIAFILIIFGISILIGATTGLLLGFAESFEDILGIDLPIIKVFAIML